MQILDPATGTGTFLAEVVRHIHKKFEGQQGIWSKYVNKDLIPRLNGFELLMASYAMAHLKMDMLLTETGYKPDDDQRFRIFLTNSLEEHHKDTGTLFSHWLADEANQANAIKRDAPVMVVMGNPPYSLSSSNKSDWILNLIQDYKKDLNERKINLDDDYIKFIRFGQHFIDRNGEGILAYISNNSFLDGITHRQMRKRLLQSFDKIYILDLHGSSKKRELSHDGGVDQNVFDIMQGVSISIFIKKANKNINPVIFHADLFGKREYKYKQLTENNLNTINWNVINQSAPYYFFVKKNLNLKSQYESFINLEKLFVNYVSGVQTKRDDLTIKFNQDELIQTKQILVDTDDVEQLRFRLKLPADGRDWTIKWAINDLKYNNPEIIRYQHRPFDDRFTYYTGKSKGFLAYPRDKVLKHLLSGYNIGMLLPRQAITEKFGFFVCNNIADINYTSNAGQFGAGLIFPLYIYQEQSSLNGTTDRLPNLNSEIVKQIVKNLGLNFVPEKENNRTSFAPIDLLDYIYSILHSPTYREKYKEFLKIDFARVPYPTDAAKFWELVKLGGELRQIHLLESDVVEQYITRYPEDGDNVVIKPRYEHTPNPSQEGNSGSHAEPVEADSHAELVEARRGRVYINETQYFENVPEVAWNFYIGGYQPAQKWLKDRKGRELSYEDIFHYQKIIVALTETDRIMKEIDKIEI